LERLYGCSVTSKLKNDALSVLKLLVDRCVPAAHGLRDLPASCAKHKQSNKCCK